VRELTIAVRRAMKTQEDLRDFLIKEGKVLNSIHGSATSTLKPEQAITIYETGQATQFTVQILKAISQQKKSFSSLDPLGKAIADQKDVAHDRIMEMFSDMDCVLLNTVDDVRPYQLNLLLVAGGTPDQLMSILSQMNEGQKTFLNVQDLTIAVHTRSGVPVPV